MPLPRPAASLIDDRGVRHPLGDTFVIGRSREVDLTINSSRVSRLHAVLTRLLSGRYEAQDLQTTNGVRLNGEPLTYRVLRHGDVLEIDANRFVFEMEPLAPPTPDEEVLRLLSAPDVDAALQVWIDALVEQGDAFGASLRTGKTPTLPAVLEQAVQSGGLTLTWQHGLIRAAQLRSKVGHDVLFALLSLDHARFLERLTLPELTARYELHDAPLTALRTLTIGPFFTDEDAKAARKAVEGLRFACAPRLAPIVVEAYDEAWLEFPDDSSRRLRRGRVENVGGVAVRWGPGWLVDGLPSVKPFRHNGRKVLTAVLVPGDEVTSASTRFVFRAK
jgi:hypothetical protein